MDFAAFATLLQLAPRVTLSHVHECRRVFAMMESKGERRAFNDVAARDGSIDGAGVASGAVLRLVRTARLGPLSETARMRIFTRTRNDEYATPSRSDRSDVLCTSGDG